jgi:hypothetical protein
MAEKKQNRIHKSKPDKFPQSGVTQKYSKPNFHKVEFSV